MTRLKVRVKKLCIEESKLVEDILFAYCTYCFYLVIWENINKKRIKKNVSLHYAKLFEVVIFG